MTKWTAEVTHTFICALLLIPEQLRLLRMSLGQVCGKRIEEWQSIVKKKVCCYAVNIPSRQVTAISPLHNLLS